MGSVAARVNLNSNLIIFIWLHRPRQAERLLSGWSTKCFRGTAAMKRCVLIPRRASSSRFSDHETCERTVAARAPHLCGFQRWSAEALLKKMAHCLIATREFFSLSTNNNSNWEIRKKVATLPVPGTSELALQESLSIGLSVFASSGLVEDEGCEAAMAIVYEKFDLFGWVSFFSHEWKINWKRQFGTRGRMWRPDGLRKTVSPRTSVYSGG